jgi:hypothetical protein
VRLLATNRRRFSAGEAMRDRIRRQNYPIGSAKEKKKVGSPKFEMALRTAEPKLARNAL